MANYNRVSYGSNGSDVEKLQELLNQNGANITVDGIFGSQTQQAVKDYQQANNLTVDGIAGDQTWGSLHSTSMDPPDATKIPTQEPAQTPVQTTEQTPNYRYDAGADEVYQQALQQLEAAKENRPTYAGTYDQQLQQLYDQIMNREDFSFDLNGEALWQQYEDRYMQQGQMAMMDAMGQAAALTGGYGNTYAQGVGQQAYQRYLQELNDKVPELYQLALSRYNQEGDRMKEQYAITGELAADEYGKYLDALTQYWQGVDRAQSEAATAYDRGQASWYNELQLQQQASDTNYNKQQNAYDRLVELITATGYSPSQEELTAAGMSAEQAAAYSKYYNDQNTPAYTGGSTRSSGYDTHGYTTEEIKALQTAAGIEVDGIWGPQTQDAYEAGWGPDSEPASNPDPDYVDHSATGIANTITEMVASGATREELLGIIKDARANGYISDTQERYLRQLAGL